MAEKLRPFEIYDCRYKAQAITEEYSKVQAQIKLFMCIHAYLLILSLLRREWWIVKGSEECK